MESANIVPCLYLCRRRFLCLLFSMGCLSCTGSPAVEYSEQMHIDGSDSGTNDDFRDSDTEMARSRSGLMGGASMDVPDDAEMTAMNHDPVSVDDASPSSFDQQDMLVDSGADAIDGIETDQMDTVVNDGGTTGIVAVDQGVDSGRSSERLRQQGVVHYRFDWNSDNVVRMPTGPWRIRTDLAYDVTVERGYLVTNQASLVPCGSMGFRSPPPSPYERILNLFVPSAHAGHGALEDQSALPQAAIEVFGSLVSMEQQIELQENRTYCDVHYLVARADLDTLGIEQQPDLEGTSLFIEGHWRAPESMLDVPFSVSVDIAYGSLLSTTDQANAQQLMDAPLSVGPELNGVTIRFSRQMDTAFDGIDFPNTVPRAIGRRVLRNLVTKVEVEISYRPDEGSAD